MRSNALGRAGLEYRPWPLVRRIARQMVGDLEPADLAFRPDVQQRLDRLGIVEGGDADIDVLRVGGRAPGQRRAAGAAEMPKGLGRRAVADRVAGGNGEGGERHGQPRNDRRPVRPLAHAAMAVERLDGGRGDAVAYPAAETAAGESLIHRFTSVLSRATS